MNAPLEPIILIGAGGHAKALFDAIVSQGGSVAAYVDPKPQPWLEQLGTLPLSEQELEKLLPSGPLLALGMVGLDTGALAHRLKLLKRYQEKGGRFPIICHKQACISPHAHIRAGAHILAGSIVNHGATVDTGAIINSGAVVEHDAFVGEGSHIAPTACVLGGASVGGCSFVASGAVVIQQSEVAPNSFIKSLRWTKG